MKQITAEQRKRIKSLYYDQKILGCLQNDGEFWILPVMPHVEGILLVKHLSSISDEDANAILLIEHQFQDQPIEFKEVANSLFYGYGFGEINLFIPISSDSMDYLRENGYAVRAIGYTVEEMVSQGVFKIVE